MKFSTALKNNYDFRRLYAKGKSAASPFLVIYWRRGRNPGQNRLGFTVGTKVGNAVCRNKVRRRLREIYRLNEEQLVSGRDMVVVARVKSRYARYSELEADFLRLCKKLGLLVGQEQ